MFRNGQHVIKCFIHSSTSTSNVSSQILCCSFRERWKKKLIYISGCERLIFRHEPHLGPPDCGGSQLSLLPCHALSAGTGKKDRKIEKIKIISTKYIFFNFYVKSHQIPGPFLSPAPSDELCFLWIILIDVYIPPPRLNVDIINIQGVLESGHLLELVLICLISPL